VTEGVSGNTRTSSGNKDRLGECDRKTGRRGGGGGIRFCCSRKNLEKTEGQGKKAKGSVSRAAEGEKKIFEHHANQEGGSRKKKKVRLEGGAEKKSRPAHRTERGKSDHKKLGMPGAVKGVRIQKKRMNFGSVGEKKSGEPSRFKKVQKKRSFKSEKGNAGRGRTVGN